MSESSGTSVLQHEETLLRTRILDRMNMQANVLVAQNVEEKELETEEDEEVDIRVAGPIPENNQLFSGFSFLLTKASRPLEVDPEDVTDELEPYLDPSPYYKEYIKRQLEAGGGTVLERFESCQFKMDESIVLVVCNRPCRTERYIRSLAANVRAVSHDWVIAIVCFKCLNNTKESCFLKFGRCTSVVKRMKDLIINVIFYLLASTNMAT